MVSSAAGRSGVRLARRGVTLMATLVLVLSGCATNATDRGRLSSQSSTHSNASSSSPAPSVTTGSHTTTGSHAGGATPSGTSGGAFISSRAPDAGPAAIEGTTWLLKRAVVDGKVYDKPQPPGSAVFSSYTVKFEKGQLEANDGCNSLGATVTVDPQKVTSSGDVSATAVGCSASALREAYDLWLFKGSVSWTVSGSDLTLTTDVGDTFEFEPLAAGYPSDLAGVKHITTAEKSIDGVRFRIYALPLHTGGDQCLTMEFDSPAGTPWEPISACRDRLAAQYVVNPTDFSSGRLPSGTGVLFSATPNGSTSRIVFSPDGGGPAVDLAQTPLPGTKFQAFYGFVEHATGGGTVTFYDTKNKPYQSTWNVSW